MPYAGTHGNQNQCQKQLIEQVNNYFNPPLENIEHGMCYMLSLEWIIKYLDSNPKNVNTAENVFDAMTADLPGLRQTAHNFNSYVTDELGIKESDITDREARITKLFMDQTKIFIDMLSRGNRQTHGHLSNRTIDQIVTPPVGISLNAQTEAFLIIFTFEKHGRSYGHAIGMIADTVGDYRVYDPNAGIIKFTSITDVFTLLLPRYTTNKDSIRCYIMLVQ